MWSKVYIGPHVKYPLFLSDYSETWIFSTDFRNVYKHQISLIVLWEPSCSVRWDGRDETNIRFSQFSERPWNIFRPYWSLVLPALKVWYACYFPRLVTIWNKSQLRQGRFLFYLEVFGACLSLLYGIKQLEYVPDELVILWHWISGHFRTPPVCLRPAIMQKK